MNRFANILGIVALLFLISSVLYFAGFELFKYGLLIAMVLFIIQLIIKITYISKQLKGRK